MSVSDELVNQIALLIGETPEDVLTEDELSRISGSPEMILKNLLRQMKMLTDIKYAVKSYNAALETAKATWAQTDPRDKGRINELFRQVSDAIKAKSKELRNQPARQQQPGGNQRYDSATVADYGDKIIQHGR